MLGLLPSLLISFFAVLLNVWFLLLILENKSSFFEEKTAERFPEVSILIPAYNEEEIIADVLSSVLTLDYPEDRLEVIVIDNGSSDNTSGVVKKFRKVRLLRLPEPGKVEALNMGLKASNGEIIGLLDADTFVSEDSLKSMIGHFDDPKVGAVTNFVNVNGKLNVLSRLQNIEYLISAIGRRILSILDSYYITPGTLSLVRKDVLEEIGFSSDTWSEDMDLALSIIEKGYKIVNCLNSLAFTRTPETIKSLVRQRIRWFRGYIQNNILPGETLLVASWGTTPVWSMQFEDRTFASLQVVKEGHVLSYNEIDMDDVVSLAKQLNATYIILDSMIINYGYSKLRPYYDDISSKDIGRKWLSVPEEVKLRKFLEMETADAVEVLYVSESPNKVIIFKCETVAFTTLWCDDTFYDWDVFLNGTMDVKDGSMTLSTPPFCENMVHIAHVFSTQINITENTLMIFKAEYAQNSLVGFSLRFTDDTEALQIFGSPGLYAVHLGEHSGKTLSHIFVYNILKPEVKNTDSVYAVVYSFFALIHYHDANEKNY